MPYFYDKVPIVHFKAGPQLFGGFYRKSAFFVFERFENFFNDHFSFLPFSFITHVSWHFVDFPLVGLRCLIEIFIFFFCYFVDEEVLENQFANNYSGKNEKQFFYAFCMDKKNLFVLQMIKVYFNFSFFVITMHSDQLCLGNRLNINRHSIFDW